MQSWACRPRWPVNCPSPGAEREFEREHEGAAQFSGVEGAGFGAEICVLVVLAVPGAFGAKEPLGMAVGAGSVVGRGPVDGR